MPKGIHKIPNYPGPVKHGEVRSVNGKRSPSPEYRAWQAMRNRCLNDRSKDWLYYGGRGIKICERWESFDCFLMDMGRRPASHLTLDRINGNQDYCKNNCRWATREQQSRNRTYVK